jgi:hypothetical protein
MVEFGDTPRGALVEVHRTFVDGLGDPGGIYAAERSAVGAPDPVLTSRSAAEADRGRRCPATRPHRLWSVIVGASCEPESILQDKVVYGLIE